MLKLRTALSSTVRTVTHRLTGSARLNHPAQKRWATYQRFPHPSRSGRTGQEQNYSNFGPFARAQYIWYNYQRPILVMGGGAGVFYVYNLEQAPITKRRRFNCISPETEKSILGGGYQQVLNEFKGRILPADHPYTKMVARVVTNLLPSTGGLAGEDWRVHVIKDDQTANAFVMPGGKVFVFTGILPVCQDENGLAAVLGHEIAHNVAHHSAERLSRSIPTMLFAILGSLIFDVSGQFTSSIANLILELPNSRTQESEADYIGLLMMAESCYNPHSVPDLWKRMAAQEKNAAPEFLSTHPASAARAEVIKTWLPEAVQAYEAKRCGMMPRHVVDFKEAFARQQRSHGLPAGLFGPGRSNSVDDDFF